MSNALSTAVETRGLVKRFRGTVALTGVDLTIPRGELAGITGSNGAGKTTLLRVLATLLRPDEGGAWVAGADVARDGDAVRRVIGVALVNERALYWRLSAIQNLRFFARVGGVPRRLVSARATEVAEQLGLAGFAERPASGYSAGQRQRLVLARAIVARPSVLLVDEPLRGLDEPGVALVRGLLREHTREGGTVLVATPTRAELDGLCDRVIELREGMVVADDARTLTSAGER